MKFKAVILTVLIFIFSFSVYGTEDNSSQVEKEVWSITVEHIGEVVFNVSSDHEIDTVVIVSPTQGMFDNYSLIPVFSDGILNKRLIVENTSVETWIVVVSIKTPGTKYKIDVVSKEEYDADPLIFYNGPVNVYEANLIVFDKETTKTENGITTTESSIVSEPVVTVKNEDEIIDDKNFMLDTAETTEEVIEVDIEEDTIDANLQNENITSEKTDTRDISDNNDKDKAVKKESSKEIEAREVENELSTIIILFLSIISVVLVFVAVILFKNLKMKG